MKTLSTNLSRLFILIVLLSVVLAMPQPALAALGISFVTPSTVSNTQATQLTITGTDFQSGAIVSLDGYGTLTTFYMSNVTLLADLPAGIAEGVYSVTVTNPDSSTATLANALTVVAIAPTATPSPVPVVGYERPVIVVYTYGASESSPSVGGSFTIHIKLYNAGQKYATNVVATFATGDLIPRDTGGVVAVGDIAPDNRADLSQPFTVSYDAWGKAIVSAVMLVTYTDTDGVPYSETFILTIPIDQPIVSYYTPTPNPNCHPHRHCYPDFAATIGDHHVRYRCDPSAAWDAVHAAIIRSKHGQHNRQERDHDRWRRQFIRQQRRHAGAWRHFGRRRRIHQLCTAGFIECSIAGQSDARQFA